MNSNYISKVVNKMQHILSKEQLFILEGVMKESEKNAYAENERLIREFLYTKESEGCSKRTIKYYSQNLKNFSTFCKSIINAETNEIRTYLSEYQLKNKCGKITIDNIRRTLSSFYSWMEDEEYINRNPMRRIHKTKIPLQIKSTFSDEELIKLREKCKSSLRDSAILDLLISSGIRIGELTGLNIDDINIEKQTAIVYGKGAKERITYFDAKTKISLQEYLESRKDNEKALFITKRKRKEGKPNRLSINYIEQLIRSYGKQSGNIEAYPHKFRRTLATKAIDKGMPVEQVQVLLGHSKIDTTMIYAQVQQRNVCISYNKFLN